MKEMPIMMEQLSRFQKKYIVDLFDDIEELLDDIDDFVDNEDENLY